MIGPTRDESARARHLLSGQAAGSRTLEIVKLQAIAEWHETRPRRPLHDDLEELGLLAAIVVRPPTVPPSAKRGRRDPEAGGPDIPPAGTWAQEWWRADPGTCRGRHDPADCTLPRPRGAWHLSTGIWLTDRRLASAVVKVAARCGRALTISCDGEPSHCVQELRTTRIRPAAGACGRCAGLQDRAVLPDDLVIERKAA